MAITRILLSSHSAYIKSLFKSIRSLSWYFSIAESIIFKLHSLLFMIIILEVLAANTEQTCVKLTVKLVMIIYNSP